MVVDNQGIDGRINWMKRFLMGSVSERVAHYARCSVMVVRKDLYDRPSVQLTSKSTEPGQRVEMGQEGSFGLTNLWRSVPKHSCA
jgi:Universal stress protein family